MGPELAITFGPVDLSFLDSENWPRAPRNNDTINGKNIFTTEDTEDTEKTNQNVSVFSVVCFFMLLSRKRKGMT